MFTDKSVFKVGVYKFSKRLNEEYKKYYIKKKSYIFIMRKRIHVLLRLVKLGESRKEYHKRGEGVLLLGRQFR